jgi:hypothetical protein
MPEKLPEFIAVTGLKGSGKDYLARHLESEYGYLHIPSSDVLRQIAREQGYEDPIPREVLSQIGDEFKKKFGPSPITDSSITKYEQNQDKYPGGLVISGLRRPPELKAFKARGAKALWVHADGMQRFKNTQNRGRGDEQSLEDFQAHDKVEYEGAAAGDENTIRLRAIEELADHRVTNDNTEKFISDAIDTLKQHSK